MQTVRILIADDHGVVRFGVRGMLESQQWEICGEATNGRQAVALAKQFKPDVVLLDIGMPELNGLPEDCAGIEKRGPTGAYPARARSLRTAG